MSKEQTFWSRRRAAVAAEDAAAKAAIQADAVAKEQAELAEQSDEEILIKLDLPDPDTMKMGDDFKKFMSKAVPDRLRRRALRSLWRSNPVLANVDMLVDYGDDFTDAATVVENMQTAYQVGKGMLKHIEEMARQAEEAENPAPVDDDIEAEEEDTLLAVIEEDTPDDTEKAYVYKDDDREEQSELATLRPRRMKFTPKETAA